MLFTKKCIRFPNLVRKLSYKDVRTWYSGLVLSKRANYPPYLHVIQIGDPSLRCVSEPVPTEDIATPAFKFLVQRMRTVLKHYDCIGLSAIQIGIPLRVLIVDFNSKAAKSYREQEYKDKEMSILPQMVLVNPEMKITDYSKIIHSEACKSVTGFLADCARYRAVEINGYNEHGEKVSLNVKGWAARIFQHEMDHLNGRLFTDIMDRSTLACSCWQVVNERRGYNENGEKVSLNVKGWAARIFQHEMDHLNGRLFTDIMDRSTLACSCWQVVNERRGKVELPY